MHHYELGYHDQQNMTHSMCEYAADAFEAEDLQERMFPI